MLVIWDCYEGFIGMNVVQFWLRCRSERSRMVFIFSRRHGDTKYEVFVCFLLTKIFFAHKVGMMRGYLWFVY